MKFRNHIFFYSRTVKKETETAKKKKEISDGKKFIKSHSVIVSH